MITKNKYVSVRGRLVAPVTITILFSYYLYTYKCTIGKERNGQRVSHPLSDESPINPAPVIVSREKEEVVGSAGGAWSWMTHIRHYGLNFDLGLANFIVGLNPDSAVEFGCGIGLYTQYLVQAGVQGPVIGIEPNDMSSAGVFNETGASFPLQIKGDVLKNQYIRRSINSADVVYSIEVAEHIEEARLPMLVSFISSKVKNYLVFSAGRPGQGGTGHISLKPKIYWIELFEKTGLKFLPNLTKSLQKWCDNQNENHRLNGFVMGKNSSLDRIMKVNEVDRNGVVSKEKHEAIALDIFPNVQYAVEKALHQSTQGEYKRNFQKVIWMFWDKGWEEAPWIVKECAASWIRLNPSWKVTLLDQSTLGQYIQADEIPVRGPKMKLAGYTDVIRLLLLKTYGGVWADATVYCRLPLNEWLFSAMHSDFFAFFNPSNPHNISSWFLASTKNGIISEAWYSATLKQYRDPNYDGYYFYMHREFEKLKEGSTLIKVQWRHVQPVSADGPHFLQRGNKRICESSASTESKQFIDSKQVPMYKLSFKFPCLNQSLDFMRESTFSYLKLSSTQATP